MPPPDEHVLAIAEDTARLIQLPKHRAAAVVAAHEAGLSYPAISREVYLILRARGFQPDAIDGAGVGPDNLRKMSGGT